MRHPGQAERGQQPREHGRQDARGEEKRQRPVRLPVRDLVTDPVLGAAKDVSRLVVDEVTCALSVNGTMETPYFDSSTSGMDHELVTTAAAGTHQASMRTFTRVPGRVRM